MPQAMTTDDPLSGYADGAVLKGTRIPVPLTATRFAVTIRGGLAAVETWRTFRNAEDRTIEVVLTVPMPVRAELFGLDAQIDGRTVRGVCRPRAAARETYEAAIDTGRLAVLHEEVLRGIHMVSVAHIAPGAEVTVRCVWTAALRPSGGGEARLRIPLTVGDVYGRSPLPDSDDLLSGGPSAMGSLSVEAEGLEVRLDMHPGGRPCGGEALAIPLDRPIDLLVPHPSWARLAAPAGGGRRLALTLAPEPPADAAVDAALLIDISGSMDMPCTADGRGLTKHAAVRAGLEAAASSLGEADRLHLFTFANDCTEVGRAAGAGACVALVRGLPGAGGGTEIGAAIATVRARSPARDLLLVTDGKSHALDVTALARSGLRVSVVLIGEDSLEAQVGHLAALTGGALVVAEGSAVAAAVSDAVATLRHPPRDEPAIEGPLTRLAASRDGLSIEAVWEDGEAEEGPISGAVRALAAALALPRLDAARAVDLAVAAGLVGPLTSLVLVDEAGEVQDGLPVTRKVALPSPAAFARFSAAAPRAASPADIPMAAPARSAPLPMPEAAPMAGSRRGGSLPSWLRPRFAGWPRRREEAPAATGPLVWPAIGAEIWDGCCDRLGRGDATGLPAHLVRALEALAEDPRVAAAARGLGLSPIALVLGLLARRDAARVRSAARVARALLSGAPESDVAEAAGRLFGTAPLPA